MKTIENTRMTEMTISVRDFGAVGDGVMDDTLAIQNGLGHKYAKNCDSSGNIHYNKSHRTLRKPGN